MSSACCAPVIAAAHAGAGPLLARSRVPGIVAERERLERALRSTVLAA